MKPTELMTGDLVLINGTPHRIQAIDSIDAEILADDELYYVGENRCHSQDKIEGIPLTAEILEKNGLKYEVDYGRYHRSILGSYSKDKEPLICVQWNPQGEISHWEVSNKSGILTGVVAYGYTEIAVHELQHILRMVGLNNIADNFKV